MSFDADMHVLEAPAPFRDEMERPRPLISLQDRIDARVAPVDFCSTLRAADQQRVLDQQLCVANTSRLYGDRTTATDSGRPNSDGPARIDAQISDTQALRLRLIEDDVRKYGREPGPVLTQLMRENSVVGIGAANPDAPEILSRLREGGATHLVINAPPSARAVIDEFNRTGNLDVGQLPIHLRGASDVEMLRSARALGLTVVPGGSESGVSMRYQGVTMALSVMSILDQRNQDPANPNRVVLWAGAWQLQDPGLMRRPGPTSEKTAVEELRLSNVRVATVNTQHAGTDSLPARAALNLSQPQIVSTRQATDLGAHRDVLGIPIYVQADHIIMYPPRQR